MDPRLDELLVLQAGVVARRQLVRLGLADHDIARLVRRRELVVVHRGVYVAHTGPLTWHQRAWAAVLLAWPAALSHGSALRAAAPAGSDAGVHGSRDHAVAGPGPPGPVHVAIAETRRVREVEGVKVHRMVHFEHRVQWNVGPPRIRYTEAVLDLAAEATTDLAALGIVSAAIQSRRTTPGRLHDALADRERLAHKEWLTSVLVDLAEGTCSVLEHGYLTRVERPHGLARPRRQVRDRTRGRVVYRDVEYDGGLVVELDGRLFHDTTAQRERDFDRDLLAAVQGKDTVRLSWGQVFDRPCWTAAMIGHLLRARGRQAAVRRCGSGCSVAS